jgi:hypothetical protein
MSKKPTPDFDPYHKWLGIPKEEQPPTHYRLLGLPIEEDEADVIEEAAIRQTSHVRSYQIGPHAAESTRILNEIANARSVLLNPTKKRDYDLKLAAASPPPAAASTASPVLSEEPGRPEFAFDESAVMDAPAFSKSQRAEKTPKSATRKSTSPRTATPTARPMGIFAALGAVIVLALGGLVALLLRTTSAPPPPLPPGTVVLKAPERLSIATGESVNLVVAVERTNYATPVRIVLSQLPKEFKVSPVAQFADQKANFALTLTAEAEARKDFRIVIRAEGAGLADTETTTILTVGVPRASKEALDWLQAAPASYFPGELAAARAALFRNPYDAKASESLGRHLLFRIEDSAHGLGLLMGADSARLREVARLERSTANDPQTGKLADAWYELGKSADGDARKDCWRRAHRWYLFSLPDLKKAEAAEASERLERIRAVIPELKPVDLLALLDPDRDVRRGSAAFVDGKLRVFGAWSVGTILEYPFVPCSDYQLRYVVERMGGNDAFKFGLGNGTTNFSGIVDSWPNNHRSGIDLIDGLEAANNETTQNGRLLQDQTKTEIIARVTRQGVALWVAGSKIVDWKNKVARLSLRAEIANMLQNPNSLYVQPYGSFLIHAVEFAPLDRPGQILEPNSRPAAKPPTAGVYLSSLPEMNPQVGWAKFGKDGRHYEEDGTFNWIVVAGKISPHGLAMHGASQFDSQVTYRLNKKFVRFRTVGGINVTSRSSESPLTFEVLGDGRLLWKSQPIRTGQTEPCDISVEGCDELRLQVHCAGNSGWAHAVWEEPQVFESKSSPP